MKMETSDVASKATTVSHRAMTTEKYKNEFEHFYEMIDLLSLGIGTLNEDLTRLNSESLQQTQSLETADKVISKIQLSTEESNSMLEGMNTNLNILRQDLLSLKQRYENRQVTSYDGTLIWKIGQFQEKMSKNT
jgi:chromosome segregation ATPase